MLAVVHTVSAAQIQRVFVGVCECGCVCGVVVSDCVFADVRCESTAPALGWTDAAALAGSTGAVADGKAEERV